MRKHPGCLVVFVITALLSAYAQQRSAPSADETVITVMRNIRAAALAGDKVTWNRYVASDCSFIEPSGVAASRGSHEPRTTGGPSLDNRLELSEIAVHAYGDTVVLTYREDQSLKIGDNQSHSATRYTETYKRSGESWQLIFSVETPIPLPALIKADAKLYDDYAGEYLIAPQLVGTVYKDGDRLMLTSSAWKEPYELLPIAPDVFVVKGMEQNEITFVRDASGRVTQQNSKYRGQQQATAKKIK